MHNLIKASLYKLFRDRTFMVTAIIGVVLATLYLLVNIWAQSCSGHTLFLSAVTPGSNFGLTIPINLVVFTVGEFTFGTIRNKIIAGISKTKIYFGLFLTGLVFTFILILGYALILVGISSLIGGFDASKIGGVNFVLTYVGYTVVTYIFVTAMSIFFASVIRAIGGGITAVILILVFISLLPLITFSTRFPIPTSVEHWTMWLNPLFMLGFYGNNLVSILAGTGATARWFEQTPQMLIAGLLTPLYWTMIFLIGGLILFKKMDVK